MVSFYNDLEIREDVVEFPPGATIISRCVPLTKLDAANSVQSIFQMRRHWQVLDDRQPRPDLHPLGVDQHEARVLGS